MPCFQNNYYDVANVLLDNVLIASDWLLYVPESIGVGGYTLPNACASIFMVMNN